MRPMDLEDFNAGAYDPFGGNHNPYQIPTAELISRNMRVYPSGSAVNPGFAYGTFIPLTTTRLGLVRFEKPYTAPMGGSQIRMFMKGPQYAVKDARKRIKLKGLTTDIAGIDWNAVSSIQQRLANQ